MKYVKLYEQFNQSVNEKLGISRVIYDTAKLIYDIYNLYKYEGINRDNCEDKIPINSSLLPSPFNDMILTLKFKKTKRPKHVHGGMDKINENEFDLYIYHHCNNLPRTLTHELNHIYQVFLRGKHYIKKKGESSALRKSEQSPTLMSIYTQLQQRGVTSQKDFIEKLQALPKYKKYVKIIKDPEQNKRSRYIASKMIKKMHKIYDLFTENLDPPTGITNDIKINVVGKNYIVDRLINNLSLIVKKRKMKSIRIKSISGYINKEIFNRKGYFYETKLDISLTNKDAIFGEYKSVNNEILIKVNEEIIYNLNHKSFDNEILVDKIVGEYIKYLKINKYNINESKNKTESKTYY
jgi:hypothetical protein